MSSQGMEITQAN